MGREPVQPMRHEEGSRFRVRAVPGSSRSSVVGWQADGRLRVKVAAPPERGKANKALVDFLAGVLGVKNSAVRVISGASSRAKTIEVGGVPPARILGLGKEGKAPGESEDTHRSGGGVHTDDLPDGP